MLASVLFSLGMYMFSKSVQCKRLKICRIRRETKVQSLYLKIIRWLWGGGKASGAGGGEGLGTGIDI